MLETLVSLSSFEENISFEIDSERLRPIDADLQVPDTSKFTRHTGWVPKVNFEQTMLDLLNYWRERVGASGNAFLLR